MDRRVSIFSLVFMINNQLDSLANHNSGNEHYTLCHRFNKAQEPCSKKIYYPRLQLST